MSPNGTAAELTTAVRRAARRAPAVALAAAVALLVVHTLNELALDDELRDLDATAEGNFLTWLTVMAAFAAAIPAALHAFLLRERRLVMGALAAAIAYLSLDDAIEIHERLGDKVAHSLLHDSDELADRLQVLLVSPILAAALAGTWLVARDAFHEARRALYAGLGALIFAVALEQTLGTVTNRWEHEGTEWPDVVRSGIEEGAELAGWILLAAGLTALLCASLIAAARRG